MRVRLLDVSLLVMTAVWYSTATVACSSSGSTASPRLAPVMDGGDATAIDADTDWDEDVGIDAGSGPSWATETDPHNCGSAGHDCDGGACRSGSCVPLPAGVLVSGQHTPVGIALDATNVYWINRGAYSEETGTYSGAQLMTCAKAGCGNAPTVLASGPWNGTTRLAVSGGSAYWGTKGQILRCATDGCMASGPTVFWTGPIFYPGDIAVDATSLYVAAERNASILTCPLAGCGQGPSSLWTSPGSTVPLVVAVDLATVSFVDSAVNLVSCGPSGCSTGGNLGGIAPTTIAVDGTNVYVGMRTGQQPSSSALVSCPVTGCLQQPTVISSTLTDCEGLATDGTSVYFSDWGMTEVEAGPVPGGAGRVAKCAITGCNTVPTALAGFVNFPQQIAVDETQVYWTDFGSTADPHSSDDGRVMVIPK